MKLGQYTDESMQEQLMNFSEHLRKATATDISICIVSGAVSDEEGRAASCGMAFAEPSYNNAAQAHAAAALVLLKTAAQLIDRITSGQVKLEMHSADGTIPIEPGRLDAWEVG